MSTTSTRRRHVMGLLAGMLATAAIVVVLVFPSCSRARMGSLQLQDGAEERDRVFAIGRSFIAFRDTHGRMPNSFEDWALFEKDADSLLDTGAQSAEPRYLVRWEALGNPEQVVLMSPDRDFSKSPIVMLQSHKEYCQDTTNRKAFNRFLIMGDGIPNPGGYYPWEAKRDFAAWAGWSFSEEQAEPWTWPQ